jgi:hypothetical protein
MENHNLSTKVNGKWRTFGKIAKNKFDNYQASFKVTPELKELIANSEWVNFSLFPADEKREIPAEAQEGIRQLEKDSIPF